MNYKQSYLLCVYLASQFCGQLAGGTINPTKAMEGFTIKYVADSGRGRATDFHIELTSDSNITFVSGIVSSNRNFGNQNGVATNNGTQDVTIDWTFMGGTVGVGNPLVGSISVTQTLHNEINIKSSYFTDGLAGKPAQSNKDKSLDLPGFKFQDPPGTDLFFITYGTDPSFANPIFIHNLQFMINQPEQNFNDFSFFAPNYIPPESTAPFSVSSGSSSPPFTITGIQPNSFIYATATFADSADLNTASVTGTIRIGHQTSVPEPNFTIMILLALGLMVSRSQIRRI